MFTLLPAGGHHLVTRAWSVTAPFVALVPAPVEVHVAMLPPARGRFEHEGRVGPIASSPHRAELMVFLN